MTTNQQIKELCTRLRLYALPKLIETEAHSQGAGQIIRGVPA